MARSPLAVAQASIADPQATPGALNPTVIEATIGATICVQGWTKTIRPSASYTSRLKREQLRAARYMTLETIAPLSDDLTISLPAMAA